MVFSDARRETNEERRRVQHTVISSPWMNTDDSNVVSGADGPTAGAAAPFKKLMLWMRVRRQLAVDGFEEVDAMTAVLELMEGVMKTITQNEGE